MAIDLFQDYLPLLLSPGFTQEQHSIADIGRKNANRYTEQIGLRDALARKKLIANGSAIVMFASSDRDNKADKLELKENVDSAEQIKRTLRNLGVDNDVSIVPDYSRTDFNSALGDDSVGHLLFFGHSKRSGVFVPGDPILWRNTSPIDHLKKSVGVIGCGIYDRTGVTPRFGFNLVDPIEGILYGTAAGDDLGGSLRPSQMRDLGNFSRLATDLNPPSQITMPKQVA